MTKRYEKQEILQAVDQFVQELRAVEELEQFREAERQIHASSSVNEKIAQLKLLQQQAVNFQQYEKVEALRQVEEKIATLERTIDELPIVQQYQSTQAIANELLQLVTQQLERNVRKMMYEQVYNGEKSN